MLKSENIKNIKFSDKQIHVLKWWLNNNSYSDYDAIICDGAIRSGKTFCMSISFILWSFYKFNNQTFAFCGKTIRSLRRNLIIPVLNFMKNLGFKYEEKFNQNLIKIKHGAKQNFFYLFGGKDESSASLIQGITLSGILFDEVVLMPENFVKQAMARCSVDGSKLWFNCNPEGPQHWFYREIIRLSYNYYDKINVKNTQNNKKFLYFHFELQDNPNISSKIKERYHNFYSGTFYERFILGNWSKNKGLIYPFMNENFFVNVPEVNFSIIALSCDYGIINPMSCGIWGFFENTWYRLDEYYYDSKIIGEIRTDQEHYENIMEILKNCFKNFPQNFIKNRIKYITIDPSASSFIILFKKSQKIKIIPANNSIISGINLTSTALRSGKIKICKTCTNSMREFSLYSWKEASEKNPKEMPNKKNDHAMDDIRYFVRTIIDIPRDDFFALAFPREPC
ncbi:MAG: PBSX family phage terminase large subunit [Candidatus Improbicoccus devescovinae]|nr:MAG: PBSX family phage terminase large subunit [Candidatus Improbicoccus devescovinae]